MSFPSRPALFSLAVLLSMAAFASLKQSGDTPVPVSVLTVTTGYSGVPVVILKEMNGTRALPIVIGSFEGAAILQEIAGKKSPRPLTHDLLKSVLDASGVVLESAVVTHMSHDVYFATLHMVRDGRKFELDSRPSDAIALALRCKTPILVAKSLMKSKASFDLSERTGPLHFGGLTIQNLTSELAARLGVSEASGVLVADVREPRYERVRRGDVIVAVQGRPVANLVEAAMEFGRIAAGRGFNLTVKRGGRRINVRIPEEGKGK